MNDGDLERLADEVGLSSRQLRRVLLQHFGVTPVELAQTQRLLFAKKLLQETVLPMTDVAFAAGFGSVRRFNALFSERYRMAPGAARRSVAQAARTDDSLLLRLAYRPPFDWDRILRYLAGRAIALVETVDLPRQTYARTVRLGQSVGWMRVTQDPRAPHKDQLQVELSPALAGVLMPLLSLVRNQFDLDANPALIEAHLRQDPLFAAQLTNAPGLRVPGAFDAFELAIRAILGQQVSVAGATTLSGRMVTRFGEPCATPWPGLTHHFPTAEVLAALPPETIAQIGLPGKRAATIVHFARFAAQGGLRIKPGAALEEVIAQLKSVPGIGDWTAHYIALRALRFPDAFPAGDLGLQKAAAVDIAADPAPGAAPVTPRLSEKALHARASVWSPWRAYAALALWHSLG